MKLSGTATATLAQAANHNDRSLLITSALTFGGNRTAGFQGKLDVADNDLINRNTTAATLATFESQLAAGRNVAPGGGFDGRWDGTSGVTSSDAAASLAMNCIEDRSLGYMLVPVATHRSLP